MNFENYRNRGAITLLRVSSAAQAEYSILQQQGLTEQFMVRWGIRHHATIELPGVSGSVPGNRQDIDQIIARRKAGEDFDLLIVLDSTRLTRAGGYHVQQIEADLDDAGIELLYVNDPTPEGDAGEIYKYMMGWAAQQTAKKISEGATRGIMAALKEGRTLPGGRPPYGVDKFYLAPDGKPLHITRLLADGRQLLLDPETKEVIRTYGRNERTGTPAHHKKQKHEKVAFVPGDPDRVAVIATMFELHYIHGRGANYIAEYLNDRGVPSAKGGLWAIATVGQMLVNPVYIGWGVGRRSTVGIYHMTGRPDQGPQPSPAEAKELRTRKQPLKRWRPQEDWWEAEHPYLVDLLPENIRQLARPRIEAKLHQKADRKVAKPGGDKHTQSLYFLKGILCSKQGGHKMTGRSSGNGYRSYLVNRGRACPVSGSIYKTMIPAGPLEEAVLSMIESVLLQVEDWRGVLTDIVKEERRRLQPDDAGLKKLEKERKKLVGQIDLYIEQAMDTQDPDLRNRLQLKRSRLREVNQKIKSMTRKQPASDLSVEDQVDQMLQELTTQGANLRSLPPATLRRFVESLIPSMTIDLETREVEMTLSLPNWVTDLDRLRDAMCLDDTLLSQNSNEAHSDIGVIARIGCQWLPKKRCFKCSRRSRAA